MVIAVVAACAVLAAGVLAVLAVHRSRRESERQLEIVFERVEQSSGGDLDQRRAGGRAHGRRPTRAFAAAVARLRRARRQPSSPKPPRGRAPTPSSFASKAPADAWSSHRSARARRASSQSGRSPLPARRPFRAATIDWTYSASGEADDEGFRSALVAPLAPSTGVPGTLVAYSSTPHAFRPEHASALHGLVAEFGTGLANARRFADVEARLLLDPTTGVASRRGYEVELGPGSRSGAPDRAPAVGRAGRDRTAPRRRRRPGGNESVDQVARLLTRVTRKSDISCRRGDREFAILMPETRESGAHVLTARLREEAKRALARARRRSRWGTSSGGPTSPSRRWRRASKQP